MSADFHCKFVLVARPGAAAVARVTAAFAEVPITTLIVVPSRAPSGDDAAVARALVDVAQSRDAAALIADDVAFATSLRADGVHLSWSDDIAARYGEVRRALGPKLIVGADAGHSRHAAMELGEANADYIGFGLARLAPDAQSRAAAIDERLDLVGWWSEVFEPPVVALDVETPEAAASLAAAGADFLALELPPAVPASDIAALLAPYRASLARARTPV